MPRTAKPTIKKLDDEACRAILARNHVGRLAYARGNQLEIEPIHYVYSDGWIYGRTSHGAKTEMTGPGWWPVVFEVDEAENLFRWRSVVVHGGFYVLPATSSKDDVAQRDRAIALLGSLIPETLTDLDPVPHRTVVFGISAGEVSGRQATPEDNPPIPERTSRPAGRRAKPEASSAATHARPVVLLGEASALSAHIRTILGAAGYRVLEAGSPQDLMAIADQVQPRVVIAPAEVTEEWTRPLRLMGEGLSAPIPLVLVGNAALPIDGVTGVVSHEGNCEEPSFARRILDEVQYAEQRDHRPSLAPSLAPH
jgi:nitroimidazol reductase NimA-like FMN-containing flavoprotein (pyridoxamine 5'-phosphate oxidase superfamily)